MERSVVSKLTYLLLSSLLILIAVIYGIKRQGYNFQKTFKGSDIEAIWQEGSRICQGENPYSRYNSAEKKAKYKPPTYFPGFYLLSCGLQRFVPDQHPLVGLKAWSVINMLAYFFIAIFISIIFYRQQAYTAGVVVLAILLFSRWSLQSIASLQQNIIAVLPLMLALYYYKSKEVFACIMFACSILLKQLAVFLLPVLLLYSLNRLSFKKQFKLFGKRIACLLGLPVIILLPFLIDDFSGVLASLGHSGTRTAQGTAVFPAWVKSSIMLGCLLLVYLAAYCGRYSFALLNVFAMLTFVALNKIFFTQYYYWLFVVFVMFFVEVLSRSKESRGV